ncbi:hypothetical protein CPLU01_08662 [Colletotrichum plurivorum]|uniref:Uncharacterized protein n=1 Tax=Colletotrichum plurivorum TaxID=2175906 RepID=A0A8H6NCV2_9PEZI|nr:hypothetical protein CPLU01_08662 [Colletotrichum plurivorum]
MHHGRTDVLLHSLKDDPDSWCQFRPEISVDRQRALVETNERAAHLRAAVVRRWSLAILWAPRSSTHLMHCIFGVVRWPHSRRHRAALCCIISFAKSPFEVDQEQRAASRKEEHPSRLRDAYCCRKQFSYISARMGIRSRSTTYGKFGEKLEKSAAVWRSSTLPSSDAMSYRRVIRSDLSYAGAN